MASSVKVGDKFIVEVKEIDWHPTRGHHYWMKGFNTLVFDDNGIQRLEPYKEPPKEVPHICENCIYENMGKTSLPCIFCDKNEVELKDMFKAVK